MYCRAVLPNAGLGNKLFPWARCRVFSLEHGIQIMTPQWTQVKFGPLLRRDRDARLYNNLFRAATPGYVSGLRQLWLRLRAGRSVEEPADLHVAPAQDEAHQIVVFSGAKDHFHSLTGWDEVLLEELRSMTRECWVRRADEVGTVAIGIHVRRGDFAEASTKEDFILRGAIRTPMEWFVQSLATIRHIRGCALPAHVVSDAPDHALTDLLHEEAVTRVDTGSAIGDLLVLSKAHLLIASGGSTFSGWAAFLGQMPTVAYPGQSLEWFGIVPMQGQYLGEWSRQHATPPLLVDQILRSGRPVSRSAQC
jgi:hypothetical protein